jgi:tRNA dimethylallyltransferase
MNPQVIFLAGPTASGKSAGAVKLAGMLNAEIFSADSRQFYRGMNIGTAKITASEKAGIPHHFLDFLNPNETFTAGQYEQKALVLAKEIFVNKDTIIVTGGSGLYAQAFISGFSPIPEISPEIHEGVLKDWEELGLAFLQQELLEKDPELYQTMDIQNPRRVCRAIEVIRQSGQKFSVLRAIPPAPRPFQVFSFALEVPRAELYKRIEDRVSVMLELGLKAEVQQLLDAGYTPDLPALQAVGYPEMIQYLSGKITELEMIDLIRQHTRNYAKRQLTWLRKDASLKWIKPEEIELIPEWIEQEKNPK